MDIREKPINCKEINEYIFKYHIQAISVTRRFKKKSVHLKINKKKLKRLTT